MRGHIINRGKKKGKNNYSIVISLGKDATTGRYKQQWESVQGNKKDAEKRLAEILNQMDTGMFVKPGKTTLAEYLEQWLHSYCWSNLAPHTAETYEFFVRRHLIPSLGQILLTQLKPQHLERLYSEKLSSGRLNGKGGLSNRSVRYMHVTLHKALQNALKLGMIARNPADAVEPPRVQHREVRTMNEADVNAFLQAAKSTSYYHLFCLALFTGMRRSELLALKWSDIDLLLCQLSVNRTVHQLHDGTIIFRQPKTEKGRRLIALSPSTAIMLREYKARQELAFQMLGKSLTEEDLLFCQTNGSALLPDSITHAWHNLAHRCGLAGIRLHDARHTHASIMLKQGIHPKIVQERLGHASIQITLDTYSHVAPGLQEAAALKFDEAFTSMHENRVREKVY
jgi:integrase